MKMKWLAVLILSLSLLALAGAAFADTLAANPIKLFVDNEEIKADVAPEVIKERVMVPIRWVAEALGADVHWDGQGQRVLVEMPESQGDALLLKQIEQLERALAPDSHEETAANWAKGVKERNGALQFAMFAPALKAEERENFEAFGWVTGVSSPWVEDYEISKGKESADGIWEYQVTFEMATSTGAAEDESHTLLIEYMGDSGMAHGWYIVEIQ